MKKQKHIIDGYLMRKQQHGGYKIVEYSHVEGEPASAKKRTIHKDLNLSDAENTLYILERKQQK